ncbi:hypothetical protein BH09PSE1_BH09PSE1_25140 [soil metagenome]
MAPQTRPLHFKQPPGSRSKWRGLILPVVVFAGIFGGAVIDWNKPAATAKTLIERIKPVAPVDEHFSGCNEARAAGRENIPSWDPSYRERMDGDGDGLACEPYRR